MSEPAIVIPLSEFQRFSAATQDELRIWLDSAFRAPPPIQTVSMMRDETGLALLDVGQARLFLNNCNDKTTGILRHIAAANGDFLMSSVCALTGNDSSQLRAAWAGMTKRCRTVTKNPEAQLLSWFREGDDWRGVMAAQTVASMRIALEARGAAGAAP